jgi:hypothetical protein
MTSEHQPGQAVFKAIRSEDIDWQPFAAFPPGVQLAVVVGAPSEAGPYVTRVRASHDVKLLPHRHPEDRIYTVTRPRCVPLAQPAAAEHAADAVPAG